MSLVSHARAVTQTGNSIRAAARNAMLTQSERKPSEVENHVYLTARNVTSFPLLVFFFLLFIKKVRAHPLS